MIDFAMRASAALYRYLVSAAPAGYWCIPANLCWVVLATFRKAGKPVRIIDIDPVTLCMDEALLGHTVAGGGCAGVLWNRTYGCGYFPAAALSAMKSEQPGLVIIDDCCLCPPRFSHSGGIADIELYSSGYAKVAEIGWGGWAIHKNPLKLPEYENGYLEQDWIGFSSAMKGSSPPLDRQADWNWLDLRCPEVTWTDAMPVIEQRSTQIITHRKRIREIYAASLSRYALPEDYQGWRYNLRCRNQSEVLKKIFAAGHFASAHYESLVPSLAEGRAPVATRLKSEIINLFIDEHYSEERAVELAGLIARVIEG